MDDSASRKRIDENMKADVLNLVRGGWDVRIILSQLRDKYPSLSRDGIRDIIRKAEMMKLKREVGNRNYLPILR